MVLSSAAASTQTTILPTARTTLSMAVFKAIPSAFARIHRRFLTPTVSTVAMGGVSIVLYVVMNYVSNGNSVIEDSVSALGVWIAFYYGLTGFSCFWYYRSTLRESARNLWMRGILPLVGLGSSCGSPCSGPSGTTGTRPTATRPGLPGHRTGSSVASSSSTSARSSSAWSDGTSRRRLRPAFFRGEILNRDTPTRVPTDLGVPVGLFGIEPFDEAEADTARHAAEGASDTRAHRGSLAPSVRPFARPAVPLAFARRDVAWRHGRIHDRVPGGARPSGVGPLH